MMSPSTEATKIISPGVLLPGRVSPVRVEPVAISDTGSEILEVGSVVLVHNENRLKGQPKFVPARIISPDKESVKVPKVTLSDTVSSGEMTATEKKKFEESKKRFHEHLTKQFLLAKEQQFAQKQAGKVVSVLTPAGQVVVSTQYVGRKRKREGRLKAFSIDGGALMSEALDILGADF